MKRPTPKVLDALHTGLDLWKQTVDHYDYSLFPHVRESNLAGIAAAREWLKTAQK